jgi:hypothetical protein
MKHSGDKDDLGKYGAIAPMEDAKNFLNQHGHEIVSYGRSKLLELKQYADEGEWTWKIAGFAAGAGIVVVSVLAFLSDFFGLSPVNAILDIYLIAAGTILAMLEYKHQVFTQHYLQALRREALFLYRPYGRAAIYFFVGIFMMSYSGFLGKFVGLYSAIVGGVVFFSSRAAILHLESIRAGLHDENEATIRFREFDKDNSGTLETTELAALCKRLGSTLTLNELESALIILDQNDNGKVELSEFLSFWRNRGEEAV